MVRNRVVKFQVSTEQYEKILSNVRAKGFKSMAEYLREQSLKNNLFLEQKISSIDRKLTILDEVISELRNREVLRSDPLKEKTKKSIWYTELHEAGLIE